MVARASILSPLPTIAEALAAGRSALVEAQKKGEAQAARRAAVLADLAAAVAPLVPRTCEVRRLPDGSLHRVTATGFLAPLEPGRGDRYPKPIGWRSQPPEGEPERYLALILDSPLASGFAQTGLFVCREADLAWDVRDAISSADFAEGFARVVAAHEHLAEEQRAEAWAEALAKPVAEDLERPPCNCGEGQGCDAADFYLGRDLREAREPAPEVKLRRPALWRRILDSRAAFGSAFGASVAALAGSLFDGLMGPVDASVAVTWSWAGGLAVGAIADWRRR